MSQASTHPPAYSIDHIERYAVRRRMRLWHRMLFAVMFLTPVQAPLRADYPEIRFSAKSIQHEKFVAMDARGDLSGEGKFRLSAAEIMVDGLLDQPRPLSVEGDIEQASFLDVQTSLVARLRSGRFSGKLEFSRHADALSATLRVARQNLVSWKEWPELPPEFDWVSRGFLDAEFSYRQRGDAAAEIDVRLGVTDLGFDSPDGRFAGQGLSFDTTVSARAESWDSPAARGSLQAGELLLDDFYRDFSSGGLEFAFRPRWSPSLLELGAIRLTDNQSLELEGRAEFGNGQNAGAWKLEISQLDLKFPGAYERYMEPVAAAWTLDGLGLTGQVSWSGQWSGGNFRSGKLLIRDMSIVDTQRRRFALTGLEAQMHPGDHEFDSGLSWRGLLLGRINLGAGEVTLDSEPGKFAITEPLALDVLGGRMNLHRLEVLLPGGSEQSENEPDIQLQVDIENLDMKQLTAAFGWPSFSGKLSGEIPGVRLDDGILEVDGKIRVNVFDGLISLEDLRIERPFGVLPSLAGNVEATNLDLELLTETFSFGQISGRIDGYMRDLRMLDWKPVAFDAWLGTPQSQQGSRDISRKAVNRLTTLGGGPATTALTSPIMRLFSNFSYKRLGLGCRMQNNVCDIRGLSEDAVSVLIMEGAGVPKITIRAFNRNVDWPQLLAQLAAASEGESIRVGD
ncbi:MAG: hypothetical protein HKN57_02240 [Xanthomonadales bacterium]|nr:YdbH domain-containing protein [Gammaproteobacteria bacterium]MBT8053257.1 YdbH domain-containing protein [Gammaproteobacteria bacterium]NND56048.1 hypothetical protein [Xanthomonadales bacterium]NNK50297.1 hypothetical protein [Xanthomonadales bacterium]